LVDSKPNQRGKGTRPSAQGQSYWRYP